MRFSNVKSHVVSSAPITHGINVRLEKEVIIWTANDVENSEIISKDKTFTMVNRVT
jgi:hypothetical protein